MKRYIAIGVIIALLCGVLAGCNAHSPTPQEPDQTTTERTSTTSSSPSTTAEQEATTTTIQQETYLNPLYKEAEQHIREALTAWIDRDLETLTIHTNGQDTAKFLLDSVVLEEYTLTFLCENEQEEPYYSVCLRVSESNYERIPVGESEWVAGYAYRFGGVALCPVKKDQDWESHFTFPPGEDLSPADFCYAVSEYLRIFETVSDFSKFPQERLIDRDEYVASLYHCVTGRLGDEQNNYKVDDINDFLNQVFGMDAVDFSTGENYDDNLDAIHIPGHGGDIFYCTLLSETEKNGIYTVDICYYADYLWLIDGIVMRYKVQGLEDGAYRLLSCEKVSDRGFGVAMFNV